MRAVRFEVFAKSSSDLRLRYFPGDGPGFLDRALDPAEVERLIAEVEVGYCEAAPNLAALGRRLAEWLDGPTERWLADALAGGPKLAVHVEGRKERLRHLPWELLAVDGTFLCGRRQAPFTPVRRAAATARTLARQDRSLRVLFLAASPEGEAPVLHFEDEEARILEATRKAVLELVVEESGSLTGLSERLAFHGVDHFDVFHLTGHADVVHDVPLFLMEDEVGREQPVTADELAAAFASHWPPLVYLSGCKTGQAGGRGVLPSFCERLVRAGAPAVLGWALPVGDEPASRAAAELYQHLANGLRLDEAVARARTALYVEGSPSWHLLRLYADATPLGELVTPPGRRPRRAPRPAQQIFLDAGAQSEVCPADRFVGRRRILQRCLRVLQSVPGEAEHAEGVVLTGMGGLGKSSLAARLCDRLPGHLRLIWVGRVDEVEIQRTIGGALDTLAAQQVWNQAGLAREIRLRQLLEGYFAARPALFVFDDFEQNLEKDAEGAPQLDRQGRGVLEPAALAALTDFLRAIRDTGAESRVLVTCRYAFSLPGPARLHAEGLDSLRGADLQKMIGQLDSFRPGARAGRELRERAQALAAGNPRLLERLDRVLADPQTASEEVLARLESTAETYREETLLRTLLDLQPPAGRRLFARLGVYRLPVDRAAVAAVAGGLPPSPHLERGAAVGLVETMVVPGGDETLYGISAILEPLLAGEWGAGERPEICRAAARHLHGRGWAGAEGWSELRGLEIHRLAMEGEEGAIAAEVAAGLGHRWYNGCRFRDAESLCRATLTRVRDFRVLHALARAEATLGQTEAARQHFEEALAACPPAGEPSQRSALVYNLAGLVAQQGDVQRALALWHQALEILESLGDAKGTAATLYEMAGVIAQQGEVQRALALWNQSLEILESLGDVKGKAATLHQMAGVIAQQGDVHRALALWNQSLEIDEAIGDVQGKAATLHQMARVMAQQGDVHRALALWHQALEIDEAIGDVRGKAATLHEMAGVIAEQGDVQRALALWHQSLEIDEAIGDVQGKAATLHEMAGVTAQQGDVQRALDLWHQSLKIYESIGDVQGKAASLHNMAGVIAQQGDGERARALWNQALEILESIGDVQRKAATLANMAWLAEQQGDAQRQRALNLEAARALASVEAWLDLTTVLGNLAAAQEPEGRSYLAQALWIASRVEVSIENLLRIGTPLLHRIGLDHPAAPTLAGALFLLIQTRSEGHPEAEAIVQKASGLLGECAEARQIPPDRFASGLEEEALADPPTFFSSLDRVLEEIVGEAEWLFDRESFPPPLRGRP